MNAVATRLTDLARQHGNRWFDPAKRQCVGPRDTLWYAIALLFSADAAERALGDALLAEARSADGTHTPATMLAILLAIPDRISAATAANLEAQVKASLPEAALCEWHDGNVNHPLAAWAALILGGERYGEPLAVAAGAGRLRTLVRTVGDRRHVLRRQAVFSEYNSPTYTALDLWFLALVAEFAQDAAVRQLARFTEERLWIETALYYHAPTQQFSGPHCRAYLDDSLGGWSALHCTMAVAFDAPLLLEPARSLDTDHPSAVLENALVAITPFHVPHEARRLAFDKPLPCSLRWQTYGESYHENNAAHRFEDGLYPGGWSQLTSWQTEEFALGTAARPYVNAGHSDAFMVRLRRRTKVHACSDFRSIFCRGVFNDAVVGQPNRVHVTGGATDASYLYEEGRTCTLQHRNRALVCYAPKGAGHRGVGRFRVDVMFTFDAPFDEFRIDSRPAVAAAATLPASSRFTFRDGNVLGVLIPLAPQPAASATPVTLRQANGCFIVSIANYDGPARDFDRDAFRGWANGFYCELWTAADFPDLDALSRHAAAIRLEDTAPGGGRHRRTVVRSGDTTLELVHNPWAEEILRATANSEPVEVPHFEAVAAVNGAPLLQPATLYGAEAFAAFTATQTSGR
ncbi:MAG: hypothetical protein KF897_04150 [Opitutaceae bacterium]|nr:hypothetical protein [Opitutaceae bacterium]